MLPALIATDVDGTLTRSGKLESAALAAIRALVDALRKAFCGPGEGVKAELAES